MIDKPDSVVWECGSCFYWEKRQRMKHDVADTGQCRIRPPQVQTMAGYISSAWPITQEDDWCGEFTEDAPE